MPEMVFFKLNCSSLVTCIQELILQLGNTVQYTYIKLLRKKISLSVSVQSSSKDNNESSRFSFLSTILYYHRQHNFHCRLKQNKYTKSVFLTALFTIIGELLGRNRFPSRWSPVPLNRDRSLILKSGCCLSKSITQRRISFPLWWGGGSPSKHSIFQIPNPKIFIIDNW